MQWDDMPKIPEDAEGVSINVRAPACPVDSAAPLRQGLIALALIVFMGWLVIGALTADSISWIPAFLALIGLISGLFMLAGVVRSRLRR